MGFCSFSFSVFVVFFCKRLQPSSFIQLFPQIQSLPRCCHLLMGERQPCPMHAFTATSVTASFGSPESGFSSQQTYHRPLQMEKKEKKNVIISAESPQPWSPYSTGAHNCMYVYPSYVSRKYRRTGTENADLFSLKFQPLGSLILSCFVTMFLHLERLHPVCG